MLNKEIATGAPSSKETVPFQVSFDPTDPNNSVKIQLPNGKTVTTQKKEVMKHVTRAVIQACAENNMNKKAASLRPFMKDEVPASPKQDKLREAFLGIPAAKRAKKENGCNTHRLTKALGDDEGVIVKKRGNWSNDEDVAILDHAAKFDGKDIDCDWSVFVLPSRVSSQCENRYKVLSRKKGGWTKDEDDAILKHGQEGGGKDVDWSAFVLPGRIARQCSNRYKKLISGKTDKWRNWTKEEDDVIMKHVEENGDSNWSILVLESRNSKQCSKRYRSLTSKKSCPIKKGGWTKEEDEQILEHGTNVGDKDWKFLAEKLPGRVEKQCSNRFQRLSSKKEGSSEKQEVSKKGGWTTEEDEKILSHVMSVGQKDWSILAKELPGRRPKQCSNRYKKLSKSSVDCNVDSEAHEKKKGKAWTVDEDQILQEHVKKHGAGKWKVVADQLPGRVPGGCKKRWSKYLSMEVAIDEEFELVE